MCVIWCFHMLQSAETKCQQNVAQFQREEKDTLGTPKGSQEQPTLVQDQQEIYYDEDECSRISGVLKNQPENQEVRRRCLESTITYTTVGNSRIVRWTVA